jgi:glycosyltransferase involved in cell wall biosynthesis
MRILIISLFFPFQEVTHGGGVNLYHFIKDLSSRGHKISLVCFIKNEEKPFIESMKVYCEEINTVSAASSFIERMAKVIYLFAYPLPWVMAFSRKFRSILNQLIKNRHYDIVICQYIWMAQYLDLIKKPKIVLIEEDVDSVVFFRRYVQEKNLLKKGSLLLTYYWTVLFENKIGNRANLILTRSEKDRKYLQCLLPGRKIRVFHPWFEGHNWDILPSKNIDKNQILFFGNMGRDLNVQAVLYFCQNVFPQIEEVIPDVKLIVSGASPTEKVKQLARDNIIVTGRVDDIKHIYSQCRIFIAPLQVGGGVILKVLNAMAAGRPVVSTTIANEGIEATPDMEIIIADSAKVFAEKIIHLLKNEGEWEKISQASRDFINKNYNWSLILDEIEQELCSL